MEKTYCTVHGGIINDFHYCPECRERENIELRAQIAQEMRGKLEKESIIEQHVPKGCCDYINLRTFNNDWWQQFWRKYTEEK